MFGNEITLAQTLYIALIGMGTVFCVLIMLVGVLELFKFIPAEKTETVKPAVSNASPVAPVASTVVLDDIPSLHKAIIISAILDSLNEEQKKYKVHFKHIQKIS